MHGREGGIGEAGKWTRGVGLEGKEVVTRGRMGEGACIRSQSISLLILINRSKMGDCAFLLLLLRCFRLSAHKFRITFR